MNTAGAPACTGPSAGRRSHGTARSDHAPHWGAQLLEPGWTRFRLWAPDCTQVWLDIEGHDLLPMEPLEDGWFERIAAVGAGSGYGFRPHAREAPCVPDPAARAQRDEVTGRSVVTDPHRHAWRCPQWRGRPWHEAVVYELHVGLAGGFEAVRSRLDEWAELGITALELMPVNAFAGTRNWGYDGTLIYAPETGYGSPGQLKELIDAAHERGLMMLLDVVYNHFGPQGNFLPRYASAFFRHDLSTPWGQAIDMRRTQVRDFFIDNALYWLQEYRFDGLRVDAAHAIEPQRFLTTLTARVHQQVAPGRHVHLVAEHEGNAAHLLGAGGFRAQWNDDFHHAVHVLLTGEDESYYRDYQHHPIALLARSLEQGFIYQGQVSPRRGRRRGEPSARLPSTCFIDFLQNHDQIGNRALGERLQVLARAQAVEAALVLLLLGPHIPMLFMDEEYASLHPFPYFTDYAGELARAVCAGRRREFADIAAFADAGARASIPDPNDRHTFASALMPLSERHGERSRARRALVQRLLQLRHHEVVPWLPGALSVRCSVLGEKALHMRWPRTGTSTWNVLVNLGPEAVPLPALPLRILFTTVAPAGHVRAHLPGGTAIAGTTTAGTKIGPPPTAQEAGT